LENIRCAVDVTLPPERAFAFFAEHLAMWWPRDYTWGQDVLEDIAIEPRVGGLCSERGPYGFRCDWGRVLAWEPPHRIALAWQIGPRREPEPNPAKASTLEVTFVPDTPARTRVVRVESTIGAGTTFFLELPAVAEVDPSAIGTSLRRFGRRTVPDHLDRTGRVPHGRLGHAPE